MGRKYIHVRVACAARCESVVFSVLFKKTYKIFASVYICHFLGIFPKLEET